MRLIDADEIRYNGMPHIGGITGMPSPTDTVMRCEINNMPTVEAVPVIRCKDCEYYDAPYHCLRHMSKDYQWFVEENDYCSLAKRK